MRVELDETKDELERLRARVEDPELQAPARPAKVKQLY